MSLSEEKIKKEIQELKKTIKQWESAIDSWKMQNTGTYYKTNRTNQIENAELQLAAARAKLIRKTQELKGLRPKPTPIITLEAPLPRSDKLPTYQEAIADDMVDSLLWDRQMASVLARGIKRGSRRKRSMRRKRHKKKRTRRRR